jgi:hypothetical protein
MPNFIPYSTAILYLLEHFCTKTRKRVIPNRKTLSHKKKRVSSIEFEGGERESAGSFSSAAFPGRRHAPAGPAAHPMAGEDGGGAEGGYGGGGRTRHPPLPRPAPRLKFACAAFY